MAANLIQLLHLMLDCAPGFVVRSPLYVRFRRRLSRNPERFTEPPDPSTPDTRREWRARKLVTRHTDLCVEGFPGSGNSFVSNSIRDAASRPLNVVSHFHWTAQLRRALALDVPAVVLVRHPRQACMSLKSKQPELWIWAVTLRWLRYHTFVLGHLDRLDVCLFDEFTRDLDLVRRSSAAVGRLVEGPIRAELSYRRPSSSATEPRWEGPFQSRLLHSAERIYDSIVARAAQPEAIEVEQPTDGPSQ